MTCPAGRVKTSDQPLIAVAPVLVMVRFEVRPVFQGLIASVTWQAPAGGAVGLGVGVDVLLGVGVGVGFGLGGNCAKNANTAAEVQVRAPLLAVDPSTGFGVWSPSKAAHWTGKPDRHPL